MADKTPMEQLIDKIDLYDKNGGINMFTLKDVLQSYLKIETEYLSNLKLEKVEKVKEKKHRCPECGRYNSGTCNCWFS